MQGTQRTASEHRKVIWAACNTCGQHNTRDACLAIILFALSATIYFFLLSQLFDRYEITSMSMSVDRVIYIMSNGR